MSDADDLIRALSLPEKPDLPAPRIDPVKLSDGVLMGMACEIFHLRNQLKLTVDQRSIVTRIRTRAEIYYDAEREWICRTYAEHDVANKYWSRRGKNR
jgi:hypothetical protein